MYVPNIHQYGSNCFSVGSYAWGCGDSAKGALGKASKTCLKVVSLWWQETAKTTKLWVTSDLKTSSAELDLEVIEALKKRIFTKMESLLMMSKEDIAELNFPHKGTILEVEGAVAKLQQQQHKQRSMHQV